MMGLAWSGTGRRLLVAFAAMIALYAVAASVALYGLVDIERGLARTGERVEGLRLALELSSAVRDQYAHVAHTVIIANDSHLKFYEEAKTRTCDLTCEMGALAADDAERGWVGEIEAATTEMDKVFLERVVPAVLKRQTQTAEQEHQHILSIMSRIQENTGLLARRFSDSVAELQALVSRRQQRALLWTIVFLLSAPLLAAGAGLVIGRSVARPMARLTAGVDRIAAGDLDTRIEVESKDEFGVLAQQFNAMTAAIKQHQHDRVENERLAGVGRLAAGVAHEINNPLGVILGYVRILAKKAEGNLAEDLGVIEAEALRCKEIVDGLLDLARPIQLSEEAFELRDLVDDVVARLTLPEVAASVDVVVEGRASVRGDLLKLRQVIFNLLKNALEAASPKGRVEVRIASTPDAVELAVSDSGPGVRADVRERLFEPFVTSKVQGTGLGLAVSRAIARAHRGDIVVAQGASGSRFVLRLPKQRRGAMG